MDSFPTILIYFLLSAGATACGIFYWMAIENMQPQEVKSSTRRKLAHVFLLSLIFTPFGAWIISNIVKYHGSFRQLRDAAE